MTRRGLLRLVFQRRVDLADTCNTFTASFNRWLADMIDGRLNAKLWKETKQKWEALVNAVEEKA